MFDFDILRFLEHGTLVGLLPVPHPILIRRYQPNPGTAMWFRYLTLSQRFWSLIIFYVDIRREVLVSLAFSTKWALLFLVIEAVFLDAYVETKQMLSIFC